MGKFGTELRSEGPRTEQAGAAEGHARSTPEPRTGGGRPPPWVEGPPTLSGRGRPWAECRGQPRGQGRRTWPAGGNRVAMKHSAPTSLPLLKGWTVGTPGPEWLPECGQAGSRRLGLPSEEGRRRPLMWSSWRGETVCWWASGEKSKRGGRQRRKMRSLVVMEEWADILQFLFSSYFRLYLSIDACFGCFLFDFYNIFFSKFHLYSLDSLLS